MIGGNVTCKLMLAEFAQNEIGENERTLTEYKQLNGWLDLATDTTNRTNFNAKVSESTHVFVCDYVEISKGIRDLVFIDGSDFQYDITMIDNPMGLNRQIEIMLKRVGD